MSTEEKTQGACFSGSTRVLMEGGTYLAIERVCIGDVVLSRCELTGEMAYKKVTRESHLECVFRSGDSYGYEVPACIVWYSTTSPKWYKDQRDGVLHLKTEQEVFFSDWEKGRSTAESIQVGDVFSAEGSKQVMAVQVEMDNGIRCIHWTTGWGGLHVTPEHPVWVEGKGWTAVRDICCGDQLMANDGATAIVRKVETGHETYNVYGLDVEDFHTYFVDSGIWVRCKAAM